MLTLNGLSGLQLSKAMLRDKQLRSEYKQLISTLSNNLHNELTQHTTTKLENNSDQSFIISPSTYEANSIQLTTFIRNEPYSHNTYNNVSELIKDNMSLIIQSYQVTEAI